MFKRLTDGYFALGLIFGFGLCALLGLALDHPGPPIEGHAQQVASQEQGGHNTQNGGQDPEAGFWKWSGFLIESGDTLAQWIMMGFTAIATALLLATLYVTLGMARDTRDIGKKQVRAYVSCVPAEVIEASEKGFRANLIVSNDGQSPARVTSCRRVEKTVSLAAQNDLSVDGALSGAREIGAFPLEARGAIRVRIDNLISSDELCILSDGSGHVMSIGELRYLDVFGESHVTTWCFRLENWGTDRIRFFPYAGHDDIT